MNVIALLRVSTDRQEQHGTSLDAQERIFLELAEQNGWNVQGIFRGCESATQAATDRRVLQQALAAIRDETPDAIWVIEQSRLTRGDELEVAMLMRELREQNVKIIVRNTVRDLSSVDEAFMVKIQSAVDAAEAARIKERMGRGRRERARQGKKNCGAAPFGYTNPPPGAPGRGTLQVVEEQAVIVRRIFDMAAKGVGEKTIARRLNDLGVPSPRGGRWGGTTVRRVLQCMAYIGTAASNVWVAQKGSRTFRFDPTNPRAIIVENAHPAIIDRAVWDAVHGRAKAPRASMPRMLTGMLFVNGHPSTGNSHGGVFVYSGPRGMRGLPWLDVDHVEGAVWDAFVQLASGPELVGRLLEAAHNPKEQVLLAQDIEFTGEQLRKAERRLERLTEMRMDGEIDKDTYLRKRAETEGAVATLGSELAGLRARAVVLDGTLAQRVVRAVQTLLAGRTRLTGEQKRQVLRSIVRRIDVTAERTGAGFNRDERGRVLPGRVRQWDIKTVKFDLVLPPADDASTTPRAAAGAGGRVPAGVGAAGRDGGTWANGGEGRPGQLRTIPSSCAPLAETADDLPPTLRACQMRTTPSCSARRGRARR